MTFRIDNDSTVECKATTTERHRGLTAWTRWLLGSAMLGRRDSLNPKILWGLETWRPAGRHDKAQRQHTHDAFEQVSVSGMYTLPAAANSVGSVP